MVESRIEFDLVFQEKVDLDVDVQSLREQELPELFVSFLGVVGGPGLGVVVVVCPLGRLRRSLRRMRGYRYR